MAVKHDMSNEIVTLTAEDDELTEVMDIQGVLFVGTGTGLATLTDNRGNTLATANLVSACLTYYMPVNRRVNGVIAQALQTNQSMYVYLRKY